MTPEEAINQLEFDRAMILFDSLTGKEITPEMLKLINKENYLTYVADGIAIEALKEVQQYREIGTVEECREAIENQKAKKPVLRNDNGKLRKSCPVCGCFFSPLSRSCPKCGQALT